ncbi:MAG: CotH kinase family protein [Bacteroidaceae bacterium]|nr:CotH kinase family protein [Bacteroidaceae bacterium]
MKWLYIYILFLTPFICKAQAADYQQVAEGLVLPILYINTVNAEEPTCDYVVHPEGSMGKSITNATKVPGRLIIKKEHKTLYDSGNYQKGVSGLTIKIRGNTSAYYNPKKPYKLKLQKKQDLLFRGNENVYQDKNWLLIPLSIFPLAGFKINELLGMPYVPQSSHVNVFINGDYRGIYFLMESVQQNAQCRVRINKDSGYLVERDPYWWNEDLYFTTSVYSGPSYCYTFKYPDSEDVTTWQMQYIQGAINQMESSLQDGTYPDYIDVESFAKWLLGHDILGTQDSGGANMYFAKYDETSASKIFMPCLWDFDSMTRMGDAWAKIHTEQGYFQQLLNASNSTFTNSYCSLWHQLSNTLFSEMDNYFEQFEQTEEWAAIEQSLLLDQQRWNYTDCTLAEDASFVRQWFVDRKVWMDEAIEGIETGLQDINTVSETAETPIYTINGVLVGTSHLRNVQQMNLPQGFYIVGKKKVWIQ